MLSALVTLSVAVAPLHGRCVTPRTRARIRLRSAGGRLLVDDDNFDPITR
jgi:hypothetical protein